MIERKKIIVVDDQITNLSIAKNALSQDYDVYTVPSGEKLFLLLNKIIPDMILLEIVVDLVESRDNATGGSPQDRINNRSRMKKPWKSSPREAEHSSNPP